MFHCLVCAANNVSTLNLINQVKCGSVIELRMMLVDWSEKIMASAAKEVHVKSVVQALPTFTMSVFMLSKGFCDKYKKMFQDFCRGDAEGQRKVHWMSWDRMIKPKRAGGIGF